MTTQLCDEVRGADLGDERLNQRLVKIVEELGTAPNLSIPAATDGRAEMEGAYRFFDNDKVSPEKIRQPHVAATIERVAQCELALFAQDTTELDLTRPSQQVRGAGLMDGESRFGAFHHPLMAFNADGVSLGTVWQKTWTRDTLNTNLTKAEKAKKRKETPIEQKESIRWIEGQRAARSVAAACPDTQCVCVGDSESDIYELFSEPRTVVAADGSESTHRPLELVVRAGQNRLTTTGKWLSDARATDELFSKSVKVSARVAKMKTATSPRAKSRDARKAKVTIRSATVTLKPPHRPDRSLPEVEVNLVLVEETKPPKGCDAICWLLVTTLPVATEEDVKQVVSIYSKRWQIEVYFRTLKSGCRVEDRQFETLRRIENSLAVYSIIAWRVMYLCYLGRECPDLNCEVVFSPSEWKSAYHIHTDGDVPSSPPTLNELIRVISGFGGYVDRPKTKPGTQTLWIGLQQLYCYAISWDAFGPGS
jgi:hypothetical protein